MHTLSIRHEQAGRGSGDLPVPMLLDREADVFLAQRSHADAG
ncbi:MAG: hypothetical protein R2699_01330 [Acidimicrobiales bacterium]